MLKRNFIVVFVLFLTSNVFSFTSDNRYKSPQTLFLTAEEINRDALIKYREEIERRRTEVLDVLTRIEKRKQGLNNPAAAKIGGVIGQPDFFPNAKKDYANLNDEDLQKIASKEDEVVSYDVLIDLINQLSSLPLKLETKTQRDLAKDLAQKIMDLGFSLQLSGQIPAIFRVKDWVSGVTHPWTLSLANNTESEAKNLFDFNRGVVFSEAEIKELKSKGVDLSIINPPKDSGFWQDPGLISEIDAKLFYYGGQSPLQKGLKIAFPENNEATFDKVKKSQTTPKMTIKYKVDGKSFKAKLKLGKDLHSDITASALFAMLGYSSDVSTYVRNFKVYFKNSSEITQMRNDWLSYFEGMAPWVLPERLHVDNFIKERGQDVKGEYIVFSEATIEADPDGILRVGPIHFGDGGVADMREARAYALLNLWVNNADWDIDNAKLVLRAQSDGAYKFHYLVHDLGCTFGGVICERVDRFSESIIKSVSKDKIVFNFRSPDNQPMRNAATLADFKWGARLIAQLTRKQITDAVSFGGWPEGIRELVVESLINRRNELVKVLGLEGQHVRGNPVTIMPVNMKLSSSNGAVKNGKIVKSKVDGYQTELGDYFDGLVVRPAVEALKRMGKMAIQKGLCGVQKISVDAVFVGISNGVVAEVLPTVCRDYVKNHNNKSDKDIWLIRDQVTLGIRGGFAVEGLAVENDVVAKYTLIHGARTEQEAINADDKIINALLMLDVKHGNLPEQFVLLREYAEIPRGRFRSTQLLPTVLGVEALIENSIFKRNAIVNKGDGYLFFASDSGSRLDIAGKGIVDIGIARPSFYRGNKTLRGSTNGEIWRMKTDDTFTNYKEEKIFVEAVQNGKFSNFKDVKNITKIDVSSNLIDSWFSGFNLLGMYRNETKHREELTVWDRGQAEGKISVYKNEKDKLVGYNILGVNEFDDVRMRGFRVDTKENKTSSDVEKNLIVFTFSLTDKDTFAEELDNGVIKFLNGMTDSDKVQFTAASHTSNLRYGPTEARALLHYLPRAIEKLMNLSEREFVEILANRLAQGEVTPSTIVRAWYEWYTVGQRTIQDPSEQLTYLSKRIEKTLSKASQLFKGLAYAKSLSGQARTSALMKALSQVVYYDKEGKSLDSSLIGVINSIVPNDIVLTRSISSPYNVENRFPGGKGIYWKDIGAPQDYSVTTMILFPEEILEVWHRFDYLKK